ncbi:hypothetical protein KP509_33G053200 [Ceratopteris richardii]|uniref:Uncharacterized protein n=1 Tax=Ceratopteris richardii TaxID=49495 RepID=A0A8T2QQT6_CERRI|nr:hypothetical protein KP509_33G053200 [Ceratopteris richardii]
MSAAEHQPLHDNLKKVRTELQSLNVFEAGKEYAEEERIIVIRGLLFKLIKMTVNVPDKDFYRTLRETQVHTVVKDLCKHSAACIRKLAKGLACAWGARILQNIRESSSSSTMETSSLADDDEESPPGKRKGFDAKAE